MKRKMQYLAVLPHPKWGVEPEYIGPFDSLSAAIRWGKAHGCPDYKTITSPERWEYIHRNDEDIINNPPPLDRGPDVLHDEVHIEKSVVEYTADHEMQKAFAKERQEGMVRCKVCGTMLSPEPALESWGYCTSECERYDLEESR